MGLLRNIGNAQSHTAQAEFHLCRYAFSPSHQRYFADAQVATITVFAKIIVFLIWTLNGLDERSTLSIVLVSIRAQELIACCLIAPIRSLAITGSANHGQFSM